MRNPWLAPTIVTAVNGGAVIKALVHVPIVAAAPTAVAVCIEVVVPAGDDWIDRAETCAAVTVEAIRIRLRAQALEGDPE